MNTIRERIEEIKKRCDEAIDSPDTIGCVDFMAEVTPALTQALEVAVNVINGALAIGQVVGGSRKSMELARDDIERLLGGTKNE